MSVRSASADVFVLLLLLLVVVRSLCPQWMAPEVLANQRYSNKADVYSFGMVMWECCARQVPFEGLNGVQAGETQEHAMLSCAVHREGSKLAGRCV
jgi:serine/threonine protein kinase